MTSGPAGQQRPQQGSKTRVAVVFGGRSSEHSISCVSAAAVLANLDPERFEVVPIGITTQGQWVMGPASSEQLSIQGRRLPEVPQDAAGLLLPSHPGESVVHTVTESGALRELSEVDVVFPVLHGAFGEDGTVQGLLEMAGLPYVGAGVFASAAAMDKTMAKKLLAADGLPVAPGITLGRGEQRPSPQQLDSLRLPVFVKPARAGSSVGISRVEDWEELPGAIAEARRTDPRVIVEPAVEGREVECAVLEFPDGSVKASMPAEIRVTGSAGWYDFETKYLDDGAEIDLPAKLDDEVIERLRETAVRAFHAMDGQGLARVDFFVGPEGQLTINELNTMPGFTPISMYARMWEHSGIGFTELVSTLIDTALARGTGLR